MRKSGASSSSNREAAWRDAELTRGGRHQKDAKRHKVSIEVRSWAGEWLLKEWTEGMPASQVQRAAQKILWEVKSSGGVPNATLEKLASLGNSGESPNHCKEQLETYFNSIVKPVPVDTKSVPLKLHKGDAAGPKNIDQGYLLPHKWIKHLYNNFPEEFAKCYLGTAGRIEEFWDGVPKDDPRRTESSIFSRDDYRSKAIPLILYGDGVPCTTKESLMTTGTESILSEYLESLERIQYISGYFEQFIP